MDDVVSDRFGSLADDRQGGSEPSILDRVTSPAALKALTAAELHTLCVEIREYIVDVVSQKGGHVGASLGVVELTVALAREAASVLVTIEENNLPGGFGDAVLEALAEDGLSRQGVLQLGLPDAFVTQGLRAELLAEVGLDPGGIVRRVREAISR